MTKTVPLIGLASALALSACSQSPEQPAAEPSSSEAAAAVRPAPTAGIETSEALPESTASAQPSPTPTPTATVAASEIPQAIRGRWGLVAKDCTSKLGDAKGLLTISASQLKFYESVAKLGKVKAATDDSLSGTFAFSGEGQAWSLDVALDTADGGKTLIRRDTGRDAMPGQLKYTRCA